jgi:laccase
VQFVTLAHNVYNRLDFAGQAVVHVEFGKTYLLRVINAALNTELFFAIANHSLTVVELDSEYVKPFTVSKGIVIAPGQTTNVLVTADQRPGTYYMVGKSHSTILVTDMTGLPPSGLPLILADVPPIPTTGLFKYKHADKHAPMRFAGNSRANCTYYPDLPEQNDTVYSTAFAALPRALFPGQLPISDNIRHLFFTVGTGTEPCTAAIPCSVQQGAYRATGMVQNISFVSPTTAILQAFYFNIPGVYSPTFPDFPPKPYDYTAAPSPPEGGQVAEKATRVTEVEYGTVVELVLQDVNNFAFESHPFHLHGYFFHFLGQGFGNYNATSDPANFNYYDPPLRYMVNVPARGWAAIRFKADNPGMYVSQGLRLALEKRFPVWCLDF